jgi:alpha-tubulin suppressor-like RCC1 family protein
MNSVRAIAAGDGFTLAVKMDGTAWAWGDNESGQFGGSQSKYSHTPAQVRGLNGVTAVAACRAHSLALESDGTVWSWGEDSMQRPSGTPVAIGGLSEVSAISAGHRHSAALKRDGTVWVWGYHGGGDLGNGEYGLAGRPLPIRGLTHVTAIAAGDQFTIALKEDGTVWAIGYGSAGQLGNGAQKNATEPVMVAGLAGVKAIAAGFMHALALKKDGTVWSWGYNHDGQLGNSSVQTEESVKAVRSGALTSIQAIAAASNHSVALASDGVAWAWGQNENGALGVEEEELNRSQIPMRVGQSLPGKCEPLFACETANSRYIEICGTQNASEIDKWTAIQYRFGVEDGPPEFVFPENPSNGRPALFFSHETSKGEYRVSVRFSNGGYTYRVFSNSESGAGVEVTDSKGKRLSTVQCAERPSMYSEYLRLSLPCDVQNPHGAAACRKTPYPAR